MCHATKINQVRTLPKIPKFNGTVVWRVSILYWIFCPTSSIPRPVSWGSRIHWLHLYSGGKSPHSNECPGYDTKQSHGEVLLMLELWGMWSTPLLQLLPGPLWARVVGPDRVLSIGQIELNCIIMLNWIDWHWTVLTFKLSANNNLCEILIVNVI